MARISIFILIVLLCLPIVSRAENDENPLLGFVVGDYVIIGKEQDSGRVYSGKGVIEQKGKKLIFRRQIGGKKIVAEGEIIVPSPPGEGQALRFRWNDRGPKEMICLIHSDLDNYARLTCYWGKIPPGYNQPGLEAMFSTAVWQDETSKNDRDKK
jgi:hypothetical protein